MWRVPSFRVFIFHAQSFFLGVEYLIPDTGHIQRSFVFFGLFFVSFLVLVCAFRYFICW